MSEPSPHPAFTLCPVLHQDAHLIVVQKPQGVLSHPNQSGDKERCAFEGRYDLEKKCFRGPAGPVWLVHRLDQDTSGILIGALNAETAKRCREAFESGLVSKTYRALLLGSPGKDGTWRDALVTQREKGRVRTVVQTGGRPNAELHFRVLSQNRIQRVALVEIDLVTGRTHQIRVQAASRHLPVLGDDVYGDFGRNRLFRKNAGIRRLCLHACRLTIPHPQKGKPITVHCPEPSEWASLAEGRP